MLEELLKIFRPGDPLGDMGESFTEMLEIARGMCLSAGRYLQGITLTPEERSAIYRDDIRVNKLERRIRKEVVTHLSLSGSSPQLPYCLLLMSLVKDVERIGDYAKNLAELEEIYPGELPDDELIGELREIQQGVEKIFAAAAEVFQRSDRERAMPLILEAKSWARRSDGLVARIAHSDYPAGRAAASVLAARYYKRIGGHLLNVVTSVVMPLHKVDYYDEDELPPE